MKRFVPKFDGLIFVLVILTLVMSFALTGERNIELQIPYDLSEVDHLHFEASPVLPIGSNYIFVQDLSGQGFFRKNIDLTALSPNLYSLKVSIIGADNRLLAAMGTPPVLPFSLSVWVKLAASFAVMVILFPIFWFRQRVFSFVFKLSAALFVMMTICMFASDLHVDVDSRAEGRFISMNFLDGAVDMLFADLMGIEESQVEGEVFVQEVDIEGEVMLTVDEKQAEYSEEEEIIVVDEDSEELEEGEVFAPAIDSSGEDLLISEKEIEKLDSVMSATGSVSNEGLFGDVDFNSLTKADVLGSREDWSCYDVAEKLVVDEYGSDFLSQKKDGKLKQFSVSIKDFMTDILSADENEDKKPLYVKSNNGSKKDEVPEGEVFTLETSEEGVSLVSAGEESPEGEAFVEMVDLPEEENEGETTVLVEEDSVSEAIDVVEEEVDSATGFVSEAASDMFDAKSFLIENSVNQKRLLSVLQGLNDFDKCKSVLSLIHTNVSYQFMVNWLKEAFSIEEAPVDEEFNAFIVDVDIDPDLVEPASNLNVNYVEIEGENASEVGLSYQWQEKKSDSYFVSYSSQKSKFKDDGLIRLSGSGFQEVNLGFEFEYFDDTYEKIYVSGDGFVSFESPEGNFDPQQDGVPLVSLYGFMESDYLNKKDSFVGYKFIGDYGERQLVIYWELVAADSGKSFNIQLVLDEATSALDFYYSKNLPKSIEKDIAFIGLKYLHVGNGFIIDFDKVSSNFKSISFKRNPGFQDLPGETGSTMGLSVNYKSSYRVKITPFFKNWTGEAYLSNEVDLTNCDMAVACDWMYGQILGTEEGFQAFHDWIFVDNVNLWTYPDGGKVVALESDQTLFADISEYVNFFPLGGNDHVYLLAGAFVEENTHYEVLPENLSIDIDGQIITGIEIGDYMYFWISLNAHPGLTDGSQVPELRLYFPGGSLSGIYDMEFYYGIVDL